jgi:predicted lipoprotein
MVGVFERLATTPGEQTLAGARAGWQRALLAWQRTVATQLGPFVSTGALLRAAFWPVRRAALAQIVNGSQVIDAALIEALGADAKGLFALEHLLFESDPAAPPAAPWLAGPRRERAAALALALTRYVESHAVRAAAALGGGDAFTAEFVRGGQLSLSRLVSQMLVTVENAALRVDRALRPPADPGLRSAAIQAGPSGLSSELLRTWLATTQRMYGRDEADSVAALARNAAPAAADSVQAAFSAASRALASIRQPLEITARSQPALLSTAWSDLKRLEVAIRTELGSALGVTITFSSADGD